MKNPEYDRVEIVEFRRKLKALRIDRKTERLCLKCGTRDHGSSPCPKRICPVCKIMDNHRSPYDCPFLVCNVCGKKHPVIACDVRPANFYAKCFNCGMYGHFGFECLYVQSKILNAELAKNL